VCCKAGTLTIGEGSTVGANAVVTSDVPPNSLAIGIPARCIPYRRNSDVKSPIKGSRT
jgi:serine O-acetyltransferase